MSIPGAQSGHLDCGEYGAWLSLDLHRTGPPVIVVEARHVCLSLSTMRNKADRDGARGIAQMMRLGWFRSVHVKNIEMQRMRTPLANRKLLKRNWWTSKITFAARCEPTHCWLERLAADASKRGVESDRARRLRCLRCDGPRAERERTYRPHLQNADRARVCSERCSLSVQRETNGSRSQNRKIA
jgi:hypothetical protein